MKPRSLAFIALASSTVLTALSGFTSRNATAAPPTASTRTNATARADAAAAERRAHEASVALGQHLLLTAGCHDCHTPLKMGDHGPEPDMSRQLSGHPESLKMPRPPAASGPWLVSVSATNTAWSGPWGVSFSANLTPDDETGLGSWSKEMFIQTIRTGRHMGQGRLLLPPMPVPVYNHFSDQELGAIFDYLRTVPTLKNRVPDPLPPAPVKAQRAAR